MKEYSIDLHSLTSHGRAEMSFEGDTLDVMTTHSITPVSFNLYGESYRKHYVSLPGVYRLPFRIDMTVRLDFPAFLLFVGSGHITFASPWQDNRKIEDIIIPTGKPNQDHNSYDNHLPFGEYADITVIYNTGEMQILINGEERFYSNTQAYMKKNPAKGFNPADL